MMMAVGMASARNSLSRSGGGAGARLVMGDSPAARAAHQHAHSALPTCSCHAPPEIFEALPIVALRIFFACTIARLLLEATTYAHATPQCLRRYGRRHLMPDIRGDRQRRPVVLFVVVKCWRETMLMKPSCTLSCSLNRGKGVTRNRPRKERVLDCSPCRVLVCVIVCSYSTTTSTLCYSFCCLLLP
ncbi:uncharacterized protein K452DRAFT_122099 [Aplosporella prunicola CBS 121167]|uniref:Uncharacterized protein n=1 Tax=Aplosporella prunicola CBS 121167 TaxID=1176127 RepID=A0A6A6BN93_9PEZI|nr:uncharacterized protein K452DRAFT_122099 [Aplosporella prunicola CBS 121167]KAF2145572.1 hypothetical protein K452DRAFT_122099 [Aplosporella prunicola CBS 121167]